MTQVQYFEGADNTKRMEAADAWIKIQKAKHPEFKVIGRTHMPADKQKGKGPSLAVEFVEHGPVPLREPPKRPKGSEPAEDDP